MVTVRLYSFSKKENSTAQPSVAPVEYACILKENSSIINPTIALDIGLTSSPSQYNYAYIVEFNRYYWINEWTNEKPLWYASMNVDVLATYKSAIGNSDLYVLRASNEYDGNVIDGLYPTKIINNSNIDNYRALFPNNSIANGMFVIGVVCQSANFGSIQYYALPARSCALLINALLNDTNYTALWGFSTNDAEIALQKSLIDPLSYIKTAYFIPMAYADYSGVESQKLRIWSWEVDVPNKPITYDNFGMLPAELNVTLPKHPQTNARGNYCNVKPYTTLTLRTGIFGDIDLDTTLIYDASDITLVPALDITTGIGYVNIYAKNKTVHLGFVEKQVGVPIQLSQVTKDYLGAFQNDLNASVGVIGNLVSGDLIGATIGGVNGIINGIKAKQPHVSSTGSVSTFMDLLRGVSLVYTFNEIVDDDISHNGRPLCKVRKPSVLGGYMIIQDADISIACTSNELQQIRSYLEGGFYYE